MSLTAAAALSALLALSSTLFVQATLANLPAKHMITICFANKFIFPFTLSFSAVLTLSCHFWCGMAKLPSLKISGVRKRGASYTVRKLSHR
jgi:hypothetical protein